MSFKAAQPQAKPDGSSGFINSFLSFLGESNVDVTMKPLPDAKKTSPPKSVPEPPPPATPVVVKMALPIEIETPEKTSPQNNDNVEQSSIGPSFQDHFTKSCMNDVEFADLSGDDDNGLLSPPVAKPQTNSKTTTTPVLTNRRSSVSTDQRTIVSTNQRSAVSTRSMKKRKIENEEEFEDDFASVNSTNSSSSESKSKSRVPAVPVRRQSARKAKEKVELMRMENLQKGKKLLSVYTDSPYISDREEEGEEEKCSVKYSENEKEVDYDSDNDPVWMPSTVEPMKRRSLNDDDDYIEQQPVKKKRVRNAKSTSPVKSATPRPPVSKPTQKKSSEARPHVSKPIQKKPSSSQRTPTVHPNATKPLPDLPPVYTGPPEADSPHNFIRGEFVIDRRDLIDNYINYPIWKIDTGRLLQKYDQIEKDGRQFHRAISTYTSWSDQIHYNYKAIRVTVISIIRGQDVVEVQEKYKPKPPVVTRFDSTLIMESFNIYIQILTSQSLESTFLGALFQEPDSYYMDPLETIDSAVSERLCRIKSLSNWTDDFLKSVNQLSLYRLVDHVKEGYCQATANKKCKSEKIVRFYGTVYRSKNLEFIEELSELDGQEYDVGRDTVDVLPTYHGLQHLKLNLLKKCEKKVAEVKVDRSMDDHAILDKCLLDQTWMKELLQVLIDLLENADNWKPTLKKT